MKTLVCEFIAFNTSNGRNPGTRGAHYEYLYTGTRDVRAGDYAIVHNGSEFGMTAVVRVKPGIGDKVTKHVLTVITQADYNNYLEANKGIDEHRRIFDQLDFMIDQDKKLDKYKELAARNPEAEALLKRATVWHGKTIDALLDKPFSMDDKVAADVPGGPPNS